MENDRTSKMSGDVEALKANFAQLRGDVIDLLSNAFGLGKHGAEYAKGNAADAVDALKMRMADLRDRGTDKIAGVERAIVEKPLQSALIAFGIGFIVAKLLTRR